jgi:hypothetical protein
MQYSLQVLVADSLNHGLVVSEDIFDTVQAIEQAKQALRLLEGQQTGLQMLVSQCCACGEPVPEYVFEQIEAVQLLRQDVLKGIGLSS